MNASRFMRLQPLRAAALRQPAMRQSLAQQPALKRPFHKSSPRFRSKDDDHSAHTISQRLRSLKKIPPELIPLGLVIAFALFAASFAMARKLFTDKTLRLNKSKKVAEAH